MLIACMRVDGEANDVRRDRWLRVRAGAEEASEYNERVDGMEGRACDWFVHVQLCRAV